MTTRKVSDDLYDGESDTTSDPGTFALSQSKKDKQLLLDHDEAERLLTEPQADRLSSDGTSSEKSQKRARRKRGKKRKNSRATDEASGRIYKIEEGRRDSSSNSSSDSLLLQGHTKRLQSQTCQRSVGWTLMLISIAVLVAVLAYGAYRASWLPLLGSHYVAKTLSNGTHSFLPTTILISLDGFRADFLQQGLTPSMNAFVASGVSPQYMLPSFPSVTFPNHYTLVTGLYPESHGIVGNQFWDPELQEEFYYTNISNSMQSKWWESAEPLWVTAENQDIRTAVHMWPGSEAHIHGIDPTYLDEFKDDELLPNKVDRILELVDLEAEKRPQLIAAYVPDVDRDGHLYGPNSTEIRATIAGADYMLSLLLEGLLHRNLTEIINVVVVSDHGMATMSAQRMVQLDDIIDLNLVDHIDGWPLRGLRLKDPKKDLPAMHEQLLTAAKRHGTFDVYTLDTMPERYHFSNNDRIAPLWIVPKTGWLVIEKSEFHIADAIAANEVFHPIGIHGFDHEHPLMRAIFIARGPAFPHPAKSRVAPFQNIEVYNIICDSLGVRPHHNNGTIRLPLKPEGLHSDINDPFSPPQDDPADIDDPATTTRESQSTKTAETAQSTQTTDSETGSQQKETWLDYLHHKLQDAKDWAKSIIDSVKNNETDSSETPVK